jgi:hypothetical protein
MRQWIIAIALSGFTALSAPAQEAPETAIEGVIQRQIDAFLADDFATAFTYASPNIQGIFGSPDNFGAMVRDGYPMVWRPDAVAFGALREVGGRLWQRVIVTDAAGAVHALDYQMIETGDGWQINAVQLLQAPQVGA